MKIAYIEKNFAASTWEVIDRANRIIAEYEEQGFTLTLRQLYYQFVRRNWVANKQKEYKRLGSIISDGRLAGMIDWDAIEDRTRSLSRLPHWDDPSDIVRAISRQFRVDMWQYQDDYVEVWIEKEALANVFERVCNKWDVPFFSCRGYPSQSSVWEASQRMIYKWDNRKAIHILHFGDHDPSGIDMTRDIRDRMELFDAEVTVHRIALNMAQVKENSPPPNPAKLSDSRAHGYIKKFGRDSWELDALEPQMLADLVETNVQKLINHGQWDDDTERRTEGRRLLSLVSGRWEDVAAFVEDGEE